MEKEEAQVIHDLKNKLLVIQHHFTEIDKKLNLATSAEKNRESIERSLDRCFELIGQYARSVREKEELEVAALSDILVEESLPEYEKLEQMYNIKININFDLNTEEKLIRGNKDRFKKVRENIVENAVNAKATFLNITMRGSDDYFEVIYENDGDKITNALKNQINSEHYGEKIDEFKNIGTKIIKEICREHGFSVTYGTSEIGTKITLIMPYYKEES